MAGDLERVLSQLKKHGLLLQTDACLPSVCALVAGAPVRGSWWAHPRSHEMFRVNCALADHQDVLIVRLISGKVTYVERGLWSPVVAIGRAREAWQIKGLARASRELLKDTDRAPVEPARRLSKAASELERSLLVYSEQFHTAAGSHARRLEAWDHWLQRTGFAATKVSPDLARDTLEQLVESLNHQFNARGRLPWHPSL
ncbi:MAG: hypothetical protein LAP39_27385 [Acidobacteriia bacterium]|nr:hypothetical protein [Terriglobia bacterium]